MTTSTVDDQVIDLTRCVPPVDPEAYSAERVLDWLRNSGGSLGDRAMKCAAADLIEAGLRAD